MKSKLIFAHPLLFAIYPVLFLYSLNIHEYLETSLLIPLFVSLIFGLAVFGLFKLIFKQTEQAAIVASFTILFALSYGRILAFSNSKNLPELVVPLVLLLLLAGIVFLAKRNKTKLLNVNKFMFFLSLFLLIFPIINIFLFEAKTGRIFTLTESIQQYSNKTIQQSDVAAPDIYYFIFDRYAGPTSTKNEYGIDNSAFFDFLKNKGFYVAGESTTNYPKTFLSLASSLNMEYLDFLTEKTNGGASPDESIVTPFIRNSKVLNYLKNKGYYIVNIGPKTWNPTSKNPYADKNFIIQKGTYPFSDAFATGFYNLTIAEPVLKKVFQNPNDVSLDPNNNEHRRIALYELNAVEEAVALPSPKFVFAHILLPHDPFVFDADCNPISEVEVNKHNHITNYINQLQCTNTKIEALMSYIIQNSKTEPIILLQSDEGPFPMKDPIDDKQSWGKATDIALHEKFPILNAYYFPDGETEGLYQTITPVNSFRVLFNNYFDENFEFLPDRNYIFEDEQNYYKFTDVTKRIKNDE